MAKFYKSKNFQLIIIIILIITIFIGVYLTEKIQILLSRAADGLTWTDFIESFGSSDGQENFNPDLDINKDGTINVIDILYAKYQDNESTSSADQANQTPVPSDEVTINDVTDSPASTPLENSEANP